MEMIVSTQFQAIKLLALIILSFILITFWIKKFVLKLKMGPGPTLADFWPAENKSPTRLWPRAGMTLPEQQKYDPKIHMGQKFWPEPNST